MKINHIKNPLAIVKKYDFLYGNGLHLEVRIYGIVEERFDEVSWYKIGVVYSNNVEIGGNLENYKELKRGTPTLEEAQNRLTDWFKKCDFKFSEIKNGVEILVN